MNRGIDSRSQISTPTPGGTLNISWWTQHPPLTTSTDFKQSNLYYGQDRAGRRVLRAFVTAYVLPQYTHAAPAVSIIYQQFFGGYQDLHLQPRSYLPLKQEIFWANVSAFQNPPRNYIAFVGEIDTIVDVPASGYLLTATHLDQNINDPCYFVFGFTLDALD